MDNVIRKRHPFRGFFGGLFLGLGLAMGLVSFSVIALGTLTVWVVVGLCTIFGLLLGLFAPARKKTAGSVPASA
jgi:hypothetical protein